MKRTLIYWYYAPYRWWNIFLCLFGNHWMNQPIGNIETTWCWKCGKRGK